MPEKSYGQIGYEAYGETAGWTTFDGRPMPSWEQLGDSPGGRETRRRWDVAAQAVLDAALDDAIEVERQMRGSPLEVASPDAIDDLLAKVG